MTTWTTTHRSRIDGSEARRLTPYNADGWATFENENGDRWRDEETDWEPLESEEA
jgi:hypothetical protein